MWVNDREEKVSVCLLVWVVSLFPPSLQVRGVLPRLSLLVPPSGPVLNLGCLDYVEPTINTRTQSHTTVYRIQQQTLEQIWHKSWKQTWCAWSAHLVSNGFSVVKNLHLQQLKETWWKELKVLDVGLLWRPRSLDHTHTHIHTLFMISPQTLVCILSCKHLCDIWCVLYNDKTLLCSWQMQLYLADTSL